MSKHYIIHGLDIEIFYKDLPTHKLWNQYKSLCLALKGDGWRAPTLIELRCMYELHKIGVMGFVPTTYWSSDIPISSIGEPKLGLRYCINFNGSSPDDLKQNVHFHYNEFRPVRSINI
jgi:hypothetical protein